MIDNLDNLHSFIDDSGFPELTQKRLKALIALQLAGKGQKDFREFIAQEIEAQGEIE